jgi:hypothetical protein
VPASYADGRWWAAFDLRPGETAVVAAGDVLDENGETNASPTNEVLRPRGGTQ